VRSLTKDPFAGQLEIGLGEKELEHGPLKKLNNGCALGKEPPTFVIQEKAARSVFIVYVPVVNARNSIADFSNNGHGMREIGWQFNFDKIAIYFRAVVRNHDKTASNEYNITFDSQPKRGKSF
jgi:hypothetical protein